MSDSFDTEINKAREKESVYRKYYSSLFQRNRTIFQQSNQGVSSNDDFQDEQAQLQSVLQTEVTSLVFGVGVTAAVFGALRFGPRLFLKRGFGGIERVKTWNQAENSRFEMRPGP